MRSIWYTVASSLDGYIAGPGGEADWIVMDPEIDFGELFSRFDTLLIGRRTWEVMVGSAQGERGGGGGGPGGMEVLVFSRTLRQEDHAGVRIVGGNVADALRDLRSRPGKDIWLFGGGDLFRSLLELGQVDGVGVALIPVLLGGGIPLLPAPAVRRTLTLSRHRVYGKTGIVSLEYAVDRVKAKRARSRRTGVTG